VTDDGVTLDEAARMARIERGIRAVREGHGANCSSIGSVIDTLFATAVVGGALLAAIAAALAREDAKVVGAPERAPAKPAEEASSGEDAAGPRR
jgi:hypothetical protein